MDATRSGNYGDLFLGQVSPNNGSEGFPGYPDVVSTTTQLMANAPLFDGSEVTYRTLGERLVDFKQKVGKEFFSDCDGGTVDSQVEKLME